MAQWARIVKLSEAALGEIQKLYGDHFPIEVRHTFADWIEQQDWRCSGNTGEQGCSDKYRALYEHLINSMKAEVDTYKSDSNDQFLAKVKLQQIVNIFEEIYGEHPERMAGAISRCLQEETAMLQQQQQYQNGASVEQDKRSSFMREIASLEKETKDNTQLVSEFGQIQPQKNIESEKSMKYKMFLSKISRESERKILTFKLEEAHDLIKSYESKQDNYIPLILKKYNSLCNRIFEVQSMILEHYLTEWSKMQRQIKHNGGVDYLHRLQQDFFDPLAYLLSDNRREVGRLRYIIASLGVSHHQQVEPLDELDSRFQLAITALIQRTLVMETQPPQVLKKTAKFSATVRSLVGNSIHDRVSQPGAAGKSVRNQGVSQPKVTAYLLNEESYARIKGHGALPAVADTAGEIVNKTVIMQFQRDTGRYFAGLGSMQLKKINRAERRGNEVVTEEKFIMLFRTEFQVEGIASPIIAQAFSLPLVVTVHGNQECNAQATVFWGNMFVEQPGDNFSAPQEITWNRLAHGLSSKFLLATKRGLTKQNIDYLESKMCKKKQDAGDRIVTWHMFAKDLLPHRNFTFWAWFYSMMKTTKDHVKCWPAHNIHGFISKDDAQRLLLETTPGNFLLRFSESELGGLSIAWVEETPIGKQVSYLAPFTEQIFKLKKLGGLINDISKLEYLYPNIPKREVFQPEATPVDNDELQDGYIQHEMKVVLAGPPAQHCPDKMDDTPCSEDVDIDSLLSEEMDLGAPMEAGECFEDIAIPDTEELEVFLQEFMAPNSTGADSILS